MTSAPRTARCRVSRRRCPGRSVRHRVSPVARNRRRVERALFLRVYPPRTYQVEKGADDDTWHHRSVIRTGRGGEHDGRTTRWMSVVFLQGEEADAVLDMIDRIGPEAAIRHLSQWDYGNETRDAALVNGYVYDEIPQSPTDRVIRDNASAYALTYNHHFGYVSLLRHFIPIVAGALQPVARQPSSATARHGTGRHRTALHL